MNFLQFCKNMMLFLQMDSNQSSQVNQASKVDTYPLPRVEELFAALYALGIFTASTTQMTSLLNWSPSTPTRLVKVLLSITDYHLVRHQLQLCFRDVWKICSRNAKASLFTQMTSWSQVLLLSHLANLDKVLGILATTGLKFNNSKCALMLPKVEYLGHVIDGLGLHLRSR